MSGPIWTQFFTPTDVHYRLGLVCLGAGAHSGPVVPSRSRVLTCYAMVVAVAGNGWVQSGDHPLHHVHAPSMFWLRPGIPHSYGPDQSGWSEMWMMFDGPAAGAYSDLGYIAPETLPARVTDLPRVQAGFARMADICRRRSPQIDVEAGLCAHSLVVAAQLATNGSSAPDEPLTIALQRAASLPLSIRGHARRLGVPVADLRDAVRRSAGCGPREYIIQVRLSDAQALLATSHLPIAAIAKHVGYDDPAYFSRLFTRRVGSSPRQFRSQQQRAVVLRAGERRIG